MLSVALIRRTRTRYDSGLDMPCVSVTYHCGQILRAVAAGRSIAPDRARGDPGLIVERFAGKQSARRSQQKNELIVGMMDAYNKSLKHTVLREGEVFLAYY